MTLPLRTRVFGVLERAASKPVEETKDFPAKRAGRLQLQRSGIGRWLFGTPDRSVTTTEYTADIAGRPARVLVHRPASTGPLPVVLNLHGGGWVQGNPEQSAWFASRVAATAGVVVVSPTYRLAPEHTFPAQVEDSVDALQWVVDRAETLGADPTRVAVMGDSAGGGLSATTALLARDAGGPALQAQVLLYPGVEAYDRWPSEDEFADSAVLTSANMRAFVRLYLGEAYGTDDWRASPIKAPSHADLPPAFVAVADHDPLADNARRYSDVLRAAGVTVEEREYSALHGFISLPGVSPAATEAVRDVSAFLRTHLL
ncbi:MAG: alpha/beta hydrolase [Actinomycetales bacterium]|nr:MAG: alpha/beta hydrolase [Actinomycetales bacterium]